MTDDYSDIEERLQAATPGTWFAWHDDDGSGNEILIASKIDSGPDAHAAAICDICRVDGQNLSGGGAVLDWGNGVNRENAELIAHAPADITRLLARVRELEAPEHLVEAAAKWAQTTPHSLASATKALLDATNLYTRVRELEGQQLAVLALHRGENIDYSRSVQTVCVECNDEDSGHPVEWPCATVKALGGN